MSKYSINNHIPIYEQALRNSGFNNNLTYTQSQKNQKNTNKQKLRFNLPFLTNVKINIAKIFFKFLCKHLPETNKLYKTFNKNTVKISYSWMRNMGSVISTHNQRLLTLNNSSIGYNCRNKCNCQLEEECLTPKVIYQADVPNNVDDEYKFYYS